MAAITKQDYTVLSPVEKIQWLSAVAGMDLTRDQLAVAITLANMANNETGKAWPSYSTIAERAGLYDRHNANRAVKALVKKRIIAITKQGNRTTPNTYKLNAAIVDKSLIDVDKNDYVWAELPTGCGQDSLQGVGDSAYRVWAELPTKSVNEVNKESINQSTRESADQEIARSIERANEYQEFWKAAGSGSYYQVSDVEAELDRLIEEGYQMETIIAGLRRWRAYTAAKGSKRVLSVLKWLQGKRFNDPWAIQNNVEPIRRRKLL